MADVNNVEIQQQLNKLLNDQKKIMRENTRSLREQVALSNEMAESLNKANLNNDLVQKSNSLKQSLMGAAEQASKFSKNNQDMAAATSGALQDTDDGFDGLLETYGKATSEASVWGAATGGFISGISKGMNLLKTGLSGVLSLAGSVAEGMFSVGKAILSIPFKIFNAFVNEANRMRGEPLLAREFEETRKSFGDFGEDLSKHVIGGYRKLRGELAETGLSVYRVLGYRHEQLKFVREQFEALGPLAHAFGEEIAAQAEHFAAYQKGLGLSGEMMKGLAQATQGTEKSFEETLRTTTNFTTNLGKRFGISQKVIGRDIGEMAKDLKTFGSVGVREMGQISVFARKLGTDFKDLLGVVAKFDNFEDAAESAARLAQAFGLNIDAMAMINEQDPAARVEQLRKAFFETGKDITKLTRQERNYLASSAGIEDQALNSVFALQSQGQTYDEIAAAGQTAEQQQITQAEAMEKLSDSIERMIKSGSRVGGFFDRFMMGFKRGMRWAKPFRDVMRNIRKSLWAAERAGRAVGRAFVKSFPGIKKLLGGMKDFFDPKKFRRLGGKVVNTFKQFFKDLGDPKTADKALGNLLSSMKAAFFGMAGEQSGAMSKIIGGFKDMFKAVGQIILSSIKTAMKYMSKFFDAITDVVNGDKTFLNAMKDVFDDGSGAAAGFMDDVWFMISKQLGPVTNKLGKSFVKMFDAIWGKVTKWFEGIDWMQVFKDVISTDAGKALAVVMFGPTFLKAGIGILGKSLELVMGSGKVMGSMGKFGKSMISMFAAGGPIGLAVAAAAAILVGYAAYVANEAKKNFKIALDEIESDVTAAQKRIDKSSNSMSALGLNSDLVAKLNEEENLTQKSLDKIVAMKKKGSLSEQQFSAIRENALAKEEKLLKRLRKEAEKAAQNNSSLFAGSDEKALLAEANRKVQRQAQRKHDVARSFGDVKNLGPDFKSQAEVESDAQREMFAKNLDIQGVDDIMKSVKEDFNPKKIKEIEKTFDDAKEILLKKGGLKDSMDEIVKAFEGFGGSKFSAVAESIGSLAKIPASLSFMVENQPNGAAIEKSIDGTRMSINALSNLTTEVGPMANTAGKDAPKITKSVQNLAQIPASVMGMAENYSNISGEINKFSKAKNIKDLPIVRGIMNMVEATNHIKNELAGIGKVNLKPKVENLGKVLGLKGSDSIKIQHENFNVDINVVVELDPTKLTDAVVDTGRVIRTPKMPRR